MHSISYSRKDYLCCILCTIYSLTLRLHFICSFTLIFFGHITTFCVKYFIVSVLSLVGHGLSSLSQRDHTPVDG